MLLNKNQIESIRYQLKKNDMNATNDEIRLAANDFTVFDSQLIADKIISNKSNSLAIKSDSNDDLDNSMIDIYKSELIKIKSIELGIDLTPSDIQKISDMTSESINDSINFLNEVSIIISQYFDDRNKKVSNIINQKIDNITDIINSKNDVLGDIFKSANDELSELINECKREKIEYKSPYKSQVESIREILKIQS